MRITTLTLVLMAVLYVMAYTAMKLDNFNREITKAMVSSFSNGNR
jgi:hypothetical protein